MSLKRAISLLAALAGLGQLAGAQAATSPPSVITLRAVLDSVRIHPMNLAAESRARAFEGGRLTARTFGNPVLSYQVDQTPFPGGPALINMEREAMTTATLPLEFLYQRGPRIARASADARAAQSDAVAVQRRTALDAAATYYRVAVAQVQVATTRDLLGWLDTLVVYNRSRVDEGVAAEADLIRSEVERDRVAAESSMEEAELALARATLAGYLTSGPIRMATLIVAIDDLPMPLPSSSTTAARQLVGNRPDVRAARERVAASTASVSAERTMLVRQLGATIGVMQTGPTTSMVAGLSLPLPLFDQNRGEVQRAIAERDVAGFELASQERMATAELVGAVDAARILTDRASRLAQRDSSSFLGRADESRRIALGAYREGAVPLLQVIDAARSWAEARMTYYRTIAAQHQSILALIAAEGSDLSTVVSSLPPRAGSLR